MKKYFLTFASSDLRSSLNRIHKQAKELKFYDEIIIFDENNLDENFKFNFQKQLKKGVRGYGYWCWKPQVILQALNMMEDGDILQYTDTGCHLNSKGLRRLNDYFSYANNSSTGILAFQSKTPTNPLIFDSRKVLNLEDRKWIKGDLLDYFQIRNDEDILNSQTIGAGIIFIKKCPLAISLINQWLNVIKHDFNLLNDSKSISPNLEGFVEHRHDQAIFSIICKLNNVETISSYEYWYPSLKEGEADWDILKDFPIHAKRDKSFSLKSFIIIYLNKTLKWLKMKFVVVAAVSLIFFLKVL